MKTAEEWTIELQKDVAAHINGESPLIVTDITDLVKKIQLDAWRQGMIEAKYIVADFASTKAKAFEQIQECLDNPPKQLL